MKIVIIISLLLALFAERTNSDLRDQQKSYDEEEKQILIVHMMESIEPKFKDIHQYCKEHGYRDSHILKGMARKLESSLPNDQLSLVSSKGGMIGSLMVATSFIPSPFSVPLFYYGSYLTIGSTVGHAGNLAFRFLQEDIDEGELHSALFRIQVLHAKIQIYELTREGLSKFPEGVKLLTEGGYVSFSDAESETMLEILRYIEKTVSMINEREKVNLWELADFCENIYKFLKFFKDLEWNRERYESLSGSISNLAKGSKNAVQEFSNTQGATVSEMKSAFSGTLQSLGSKWSSIFVGFTSVLNICNEAASIESTEEHIRIKKHIIQELREIAENVDEICRKSNFCE